MPSTIIIRASALAAVILSAPLGLAQDEPKPAPDYTVHPDAPSMTFHSATIEGETVTYLATAGTTTMVNGQHEAAAKMFHISYRKAAPRRAGLEQLRKLVDLALDDEDKTAELDRHMGLHATDDASAMTSMLIDQALAMGVDPGVLFEFPDPATRPITFSFNGGPGSSSVWLHLGLFGPKRVKHVDDFGNPGPPPYELVNNEFSLLNRSDFVFIDPISTGFSRAEEGVSANDFHGLENDISSVGEFIRRWIGDHGRWGSPKFIAGESYGTTRAAGLASHLVGRHGIALNGVVLISAVTNFATIRFGIGNDLPHLLYFPSFAATAHFHGQLDERYQGMAVAEFVAEVEQFAINEYAPALLRGDALPDDEVERIAGRIADYTGVSAEYAKRVNLRLDMPRFPKELRRDEGITVGRLDSRFTAFDRDDGGSSYEFDPSMNAINAIYTESLNNYVREELKYDSDLVYEILTGVYPWSYGNSGNNRYANVAERLRGAMHRTPSMKVFIASGYYDLATPYFATDYTTDHMQLEPTLRGNIETHYYEAGHMMYVHLPSLTQVRADLGAFYDRALAD